MSKYQITDDHFVYFITFSVVDWLPIFIAETPCLIVTNSFNYCHMYKYLRTNSYVIMPTHLHAIVFDEDHVVNRLKDNINSLRRHTGKELIAYCKKKLQPEFLRLISDKSGADRRYRFWQLGIHPVSIYTHKFWKQKTDYIHDNPRKKGLVREAHCWRFSSANFWLNGGDSDVILSEII